MPLFPSELRDDRNHPEHVRRLGLQVSEFSPHQGSDVWWADWDGSLRRGGWQTGLSSPHFLSSYEEEVLPPTCCLCPLTSPHRQAPALVILQARRLTPAREAGGRIREPRTEREIRWVKEPRVPVAEPGPPS